MFGNNPYAAGGWYNPQNPSFNQRRWPPHVPQCCTPTYIWRLAPQQTIRRRHSSSTSPQLNLISSILPSTAQMERHTFESARQNGVTAIMKPRNESLARIEWQATPIVEIRNVLPKANASQWLRLSQDQGRSYSKFIIAPKSSPPLLQLSNYDPLREALCLVPRGVAISDCQVIQHGVLELTSEAIQAGLLEASAVATILFQSGRNMA
ncbi:hypothetical protein BKA70DRAFT_1231066 [Coprinopsis sp. MPI-PUGE-AT-0042]|nr:hypothetical protein BKA70DRAFT_1231066 [Coprinopsis sp. MPI-PUGE-AT-0042]